MTFEASFYHKSVDKDTARKDSLTGDINRITHMIKKEEERLRQLKEDRDHLRDMIKNDVDRCKALRRRITEIDRVLKKPAPDVIKPSSNSHPTKSPPDVLTPRCIECHEYARYPGKLKCFHCLKMRYDIEMCRTINETGANVGRQCGYKPTSNGRCTKHNEEYIDVMLSSDEESDISYEEVDDSIVIPDHSSSGEYEESSDEYDSEEDRHVNKKSRRY